MSEAHCNNLAKRKALGLVTHDNTGGPFVVECQGCGSVYPSYQCFGGGQIADTGDYDDARCPHCEQVDPEECGNVGLAWNTQQLKINELQQRLTAADDRLDAGISFVTRMIKCAGGQPSIATSYLRDILDKLKPAEGQPLTTCTWSSHEFSWSSNCGMNGWEFTDGGAPAENGMRFCHSCGRTLVVEGEDED